MLGLTLACLPFLYGVGTELGTAGAGFVSADSPLHWERHTSSGIMKDLSTFLVQHPHISPDVLQRIELFRASMELEVRQTVQRVQERKLSPYTGDDLGGRLSMRAVREVEDIVIALCSRLYEIVATQYAAAPGVTGDLTALFEELADAALMEAQRLFRNVTAGMWFERTPSLEALRPHEERKDKTPYREIADYPDPEPMSSRVASVVCERVEPLRIDMTAAAMRLRVEHLKELVDRDRPDTETAARGAESTNDPQTAAEVADAKGTHRRAAVDGYIEEVFSKTGRRITRKEIWKAAGYTSRTEFERWERYDPKNPNRAAHRAFMRILSEKPHLK